MTRLLPRTQATLVATLSLFMFVVGRSDGAEPPFQLPKDRDTVFRRDEFWSTSYFYFGKDGKYRQVTRQHMYTADYDFGTWTQDPAGKIELCSAFIVNPLESGPFRVPVRYVHKLEPLRRLEKDIGTLLSADERDSYTREEIERAWNYSYAQSAGKPDITFYGVKVNSQAEKVTRSQIREFLAAWKAYLKGDAKSRFRLVPVVYHKFVLLAGDNHWAVRDSPEEVKKTADRHGGPDKSPSTVYVMTDPAIALKEMETTQPFIFYPEMHRRIGGAPTKDK